jgi:DNA adenine methylase
MKPFLKWAGNKYRCIDNILSSLPHGKRLIEPFTGSGAVFLNTNYEQYLLADGNNDLITLYQQLKNEGPGFIKYCSRLFNEKTNDAEFYYSMRKKFNSTGFNRKRAALFLYLNRHGYNGLCRYNLSGGFNVPFGSYKIPYFPRQEMHCFHQSSQRCEFLHSDFRDTFLLAKTGDVIYCDPPYVPLSKSSNFTSYTNRSFGEQEQIELVDLALECAQKGITTIISNHDTKFTRNLYRQATTTNFDVKRSISCHGKKRQTVREIIAIFH